MDFRLIIILCTLIFESCSTTSPNIWSEILDSNHPKLNKVLQQPDKYKLQIIYTEIYRDNGQPLFKRHIYNLDTNHYFYPASTVKLPVAALALEKLKEIKTQNPKINIHTPILFDSIRPTQSKMSYDSCSPSGFPTIASLIDQIFAISDNNAYNRLFEFLGQEFINERLYEKKIFTNSRILTRVGVTGYDSIENTYCNPIKFIEEDYSIVLEIPAQKSAFNNYPPIPHSNAGKGYFDDNKGIVVMEPFDMSRKNFVNLSDIDRIIKTIIYPEVFSHSQRFDIDKSDHQYLISSMKKLPSDVPCYENHTDHYYDGYVKFFIFGDSKKNIPSHITIKNKVGLAYGYLTDIAHIIDSKNEIEFFLSATLLVNENDVFNDGEYEYDGVGIPFLAELGRQVYAYELSKRKQSK